MTTTSPASTRSPSSRETTRRKTVPLRSDDLSQFAKQLRSELAEHHARNQGVPGHVQLLNMLARAAGHRNVQALQAGAVASPAAPEASLAAPLTTPPAVAPATAPATTLTATAQKALAQFDDWGRLTRWPHKYSVQRLAMWALWLRFDSGRVYSEREVNEILKAWSLYGDHVTPRRELVEMKLLGRKPDCSAYWKEAQRPSDEVRSLLQALRARRP
ncbi:MAG TPA: DUF2087 domain-containing protein [Ideonella sp.]|nr:DUF2087 domain-containing protein [Ideonella sp.]